MEKEELIQILQEKAKKLKRAPKKRDIQYNSYWYKLYFGSWENALLEAGVKKRKDPDAIVVKRAPYQKHITKQEWIRRLQKEAAEKGRTPLYTEFQGTHHIIRQFGSWNEGLIAAGLKVNKRRKTKKKTEEIHNSIV